MVNVDLGRSASGQQRRSYREPIFTNSPVSTFALSPNFPDNFQGRAHHFVADDDGLLAARTCACRLGWTFAEVEKQRCAGSMLAVF